MKENYYDILEVNKNASPEIIDKAYKVLVKKYHPDLQEGELKQKYEHKLKLINEAYDVLSDEVKRKQYNIELKQTELLQKDNINYNNIQTYSNGINTNQNTQSYRNKFNNNCNTNNNYDEQKNNINYHIKQARIQTEEQKRYEEEYNRQVNNAINKAYHDAYIQDLKNRGYKIKYKKNLKDYFKNFISIIILFIVILILLQVPFVKNHFIKLYQENYVFKYIIDLFINLINGIFY